ncbi:helix-turn-helix transcriptional regulator [Chitiniphilus shinanonensis]|uniref:helix-turn-helix transcriptional regulator n=1 Tax=Chitiniphilus shinanonensis TaxID=553088 RepID=UPI003072C6B9
MKNKIAMPADRVIWRQDLMSIFGVTSETIRRWLRANRLPEPDVDISNRTKGWRVSTLRAAGINIE